MGMALNPKSSYVITWPTQFTSRKINALSPNSDQHQFSPNNIHMLPRGMVMRVNKMITKEKCFDLLLNSLNLFFKEMYEDQYGEFICGHWGLKD